MPLTPYPDPAAKLPEWTPPGRAQTLCMERQLERIKAEQAAHVALAERQLETARETEAQWLEWATRQVELARRYEADAMLQEPKR